MEPVGSMEFFAKQQLSGSQENEMIHNIWYYKGNLC